MLRRWISSRPHSCVQECGTARKSTFVEHELRSRSAYLRVALTYMLISMPQGTSTIFGAFQAILALLCKGDELPPSPTNYSLTKTSPVNSFGKSSRACGLRVHLLRCNKAFCRGGGGRAKSKDDQGVLFRSGMKRGGQGTMDCNEYRIKNL